MLEGIKTKVALSLLGKKSMFLTSPEVANFFRGTYSLNFLPGQPVYTELTLAKAVREGYKMAAPVYRAIRTIVQAASGIPWIVIDKDGQEIPDHAFTKVWASPNPQFSGQDNMEFIIAHLLLVGNALLQPIYVGKEPREFWIAMPDRIQPIPSKDKNLWLDGWQYTDEYGHMTKLPKEQFIHFMQFDPGNPYWGIGALQAAGRTVDTFNEALDTQKVSMQNRGMPSGILTPDEPMNPEQFEEAKRVVKERYLDKSTRREPWLVSRGLKWQETSLTPVELDYIKSQAQNIRDIAGTFGIDPWWLGDREHSTFNNVAEARKSLYEDTALPMLDDIRATLNLRIAPLYGDDIYIDYDTSNIAALRDDFGKAVEQARNLWAMGIPFNQINDKLELGFEEFEGWDRGYLPFSLAPVGSGGTPEIAQGLPAVAGAKSLILTEDQKAMQWKRVDGRRVAYWGLLQKKFQPLYQNLGKAVGDTMVGDSSELLGKVNTAIDKQSPVWEKMIVAAVLILIEDFGNEIAQQLKSVNRPSEVKQFDAFTRAIRAWAARHAADSVKTILDTQREAMHNLIAKGIEDNLSNVQIAKSIRGFYDDNARYLAMRVARTETATAAGYGQHQAAKQSGANRKAWITSRDDRVRDLHQEMDGESAAIDEPYSNGMMNVGDPAGGPENVINCRCAEQYFVERE